MKNRKDLLEKLGIKAEQMIILIGGKDELISRIAKRVGERGEVASFKDYMHAVKILQDREADIILVWANVKDEILRYFSNLKNKIKTNGAIWMVLKKKAFQTDRSPAENDVLEAGRKMGLLDVKVVKVSETEYALKFVIPRLRR